MGPVRSKLELKHFESIFLERIITNDLQSSNLFIYVILQLSPHELKERQTPSERSYGQLAQKKNLHTLEQMTYSIRLQNEIGETR